MFLWHKNGRKRPISARGETTENVCSRCDPKYALPSLWKRDAGLGVIILGGSLLMEIGCLFILLLLESGFNIRDSFEENPWFLRAAKLSPARTIQEQ